ncbi:MAG: DNA recombination protein RmuC [Candidatus Omnitrophica bacterium]|nr:DNA recombination protein RmuC [Candidatus Omnitrophota bacterium]
MGINFSIIILVVFISCGLGFLAGYAITQSRSKKDISESTVLKTRLAISEQALNEAKSLASEREARIEELRTILESSEREKAVSDTKLVEAIKSVEDQKKLLASAEEKLSTTFQALSGESLKSNNRAFLELAKESLGIVLSDAKGELNKKEESIKNIIKPLENALSKYEAQIGEMEKSRIAAYSSLENQIRTLISSEAQLQKETGNLVSALRRPEVRGRWGEVTLRRVVELAGLSEHCDYTEQVSVETEDGRLRPDMIVHLPNDREIVIDSKVSLDAYLDAVACQDPARRSEMISKHAQQVRRHMKMLSEKNYWEQFPKAPEFVVMFMPGESFLAAALDIDNALIEQGMESKVIIATPTTLIALLRAIAFGWRQENIAKNAQKIAALGKEIYDRFGPFIEHMNRLGLGLAQSVNSFNKMATSLERRVMVSVRRFKELGASGDKDLPEIEEVEEIPVNSNTKEALNPAETKDCESTA